MNFDLGQYAGIIWTAYAISAAALGGVTLWSVLAYRAAKAKLAALEKK
jgi:heme exporter protein CcmD